MVGSKNTYFGPSDLTQLDLLRLPIGWLKPPEGRGGGVTIDNKQPWVGLDHTHELPTGIRRRKKILGIIDAIGSWLDQPIMSLNWSKKHSSWGGMNKNWSILNVLPFWISEMKRTSREVNRSKYNKTKNIPGHMTSIPNTQHVTASTPQHTTTPTKRVSWLLRLAHLSGDRPH